MKNKYYTPSLEEFRIGFEYEWSRDGEGATDWTKSKMSMENGPIKDIDAWRMNRYRVKYLDKEDIESLGFKLIKNNKDHYLFNIGMFETLLLYKFNEEDYDEDETYLGPEVKINECKSTSFYGYIKNISELKQVLNMIGVDYVK